MRIFLNGIALLLSCLLLQSTSLAQEIPDQRPLHISMVPKKNLDQQIEEIQPLVRLLSDKLQRPVVIVRVSSYQAVIEGLLSADIDLAIMGPASYSYAKRRDPAIEAFASIKRRPGPFTPQGSYYQSLLVTLSASKLQTINDLKGKNVALTDPKSTSGAVIPEHEFGAQVAMSVRQFFGVISYTGSHDRSIRALINHQTDGAFLSSSRLDEAVRQQIITPQQIRVLWHSQPIHYDPFVFRGKLPQDLKTQIAEIMFSSSQQLETMLDKKNAISIVPVCDRDYANIHDITVQE